MPSTSVSENTYNDFNPADRNLFDFAEILPSSLNVGLSKLNWILVTQVFIDGVDLSHWNWSVGKEPDFKVIKANGFDFVMLKATESDWFVDDKFEPGWISALDNDLIVMPYHFNRTDLGGAVQAHWHLYNIADFLKSVNGKTICWNDIETNDGGTTSQHQNRAKAYNQTIVEEGFLTGNYSSYYLWKLVMGAVPLPWVNDYHQWVAHWTPNTSPLMPIGWERKEFWQYGIWPTYSWAKTVGTDGNVDVNRFYGTLADLKELLGTNGIPSDCCDEIKEELAQVHAILAVTNDRVSTNERNINALQQDDVAISERIDAIELELYAVKTNVSQVEGAQQVTQEQVSELMDLLEQVRGLLCV